MVACLSATVGCAVDAAPAEDTQGAESELVTPFRPIPIPRVKYATTGFYFDQTSFAISGFNESAMFASGSDAIIHSGSMTRLANNLIVVPESRATGDRPLEVIGSYASNPTHVAAAIPGPFNGRTRAAGLAIGDLDRNGTQDLVYFTAEQLTPSDDSSIGYYRIGWDFDVTTGNARWGARTVIPGWRFGGVNGGGVALGDVDNDGKLDLITFHVTDYPGENVGYYKIGWDLGADDKAQGWTEFRSMGSAWFGGNGVGTGLAAADLDANGKLDLVVMSFDQGDNLCDCGYVFPNPAGGCDFCHYGWSIPYYRIIKDLSPARSDAGLAASIGGAVSGANNPGVGSTAYGEPGGVALVPHGGGAYMDLLFRTTHGTVVFGHGFGYTF
jgi:hypothetical protein